ncbi:MAG: hypothetical protein AAGD92_01860 [Pseudomonadota bacterium]
MLKKTLLTTASVVVASCGVIGAAQAGELKLKLRDVNIKEIDDGEIDPDFTLHTDTDGNGGIDANGFAGPNGNVAPRNARSIDKPFAAKAGELAATQVVLAEERMGGESNPIGGFYEIDVFEVTGAATFTEVTRFDISLDGDIDAWFKEDVNCANAIRAGSDNVHSVSANTAAGGQPILAGENIANCNVTIQQGGNGLLPDSTIGWVLPIEVKNCVDGAELIISMVVTRQDPVTGGTIVDDISHPVAVCKDSLKAEFAFNPVKIDYFTDFTSFLVDPDWEDDVEEHVATFYADVGGMFVDLHHNLVDLKEEDKSSQTNVFDVSDIASLDLVVQFDDPELIGIKEVELDGAPGVINRTDGTVTWDFNNAQIQDIFGLSPADGEDKGEKDLGDLVLFTVHAFGPESSNPFNGPIKHQDARVLTADFNLTPDTCFGFHCVKFFTPESEGDGQQVAELNKTGITFGAFDWVADPTALVRNVFRVTGIPEDFIASEGLKGTIQIENSSVGEDFAIEDVYKVEYDLGLVSNGVLIITPERLRDLIVADGAPNGGNWGNADITFTFFLPGTTGFKVDMDRLLRSEGTYASYGDNSNDGNSLKARSCDDGRFGPHVANKLDPRFTRMLTRRCGRGELPRRGLFFSDL